MFDLIDYAKLNSRQQENYNFHKIAARLADYGYNAMRLSDDFEGADFIALHIDGESILRVQLKGRLSFHAKYYGKNLHIVFRDGDDIYMYPHDELRLKIEAAGLLEKSNSRAWVVHGSRSWPNIPKNLKKQLLEYKL
tara:strand:- start:545 stop:955 length:411 start_codon:yes stop_codon:yes gene_type:complete